MLRHYKLLLTLGFALLAQASLQAQTFIDKVTNLFEFEIHNKDHYPNNYPTKVVLAPIISYEPATSVGFGIGSKLLFKPKNAGNETRTSNLPISILYTLKNQIIFSSSYNIFFPREQWLLKGNMGYSKFPVGFFGLGANTLQEDKKEVSFDRVLIEPLLLRKMHGTSWFVGGGLRYHYTYNGKLKEDSKVPATDQFVDSLNATSLGVEFAASLDSRDNVLNATTGDFLEFTHGVYDDVAGGTNEFMLTKMDFRKYFRTNPDKLNIVAIQLYSRFSWGNTPLLELSTLGGAEFLRGFQEGRFRDEFAYFTQVEYRWQAFRRFGFVFFGGAGDVKSREDEFTLQSLKYSLGTGLRLKIVEKENLNIRLDYAFGFGDEIENNFYLGIAEAF